MSSVFNILKQQILHFPLITRLAFYETKSKYQMHYLGILWQFLNPLLQVSVYWFVFGVGIRNGDPVDGTPFFIWLLTGLVPWFFISPTIVQGSNSIYSKINLVSKMKFPVSVLPSITIASNIFGFLITIVILSVVMVIYDIKVSIYALQLPYYLLCLFFLLYSITIFTSTISALIRDFQLLIQTSMRMLFFMTPILWSVNEFPERYQALIQLNPFAYIVNGFRESLLSETWFFEDWRYAFYFWSFLILILFVGTLLHENYKNKFVDYL
ncbi:ABC transporter permease [Sediminibacillus dalangtanensis]|uniref:Transport permease protein n=1 Tax=Sediminibacillus dalangtanensis TaxID=2729421 RepID=A0ABX7VUY9_9BACI|nr:ABC transporter permease [Sediminibacillus dalangtanensis]QTN00778.1 ABC transporter permease [Sediminibacillus dalangtanensis]